MEDIQLDESEVPILIEAIKQYGNKWVTIQKKFFPSYKITDLRKFYQKINIEPFDSQSPQTLRHCSSNVQNYIGDSLAFSDNSLEIEDNSFLKIEDLIDEN